MDCVEELVGRCVTIDGVMLEDDEFLGGHLAAGGGVVHLKHVHQCKPEFRQVILGETGITLCQVGGDVAIHAVQRIGNDELVSERAGVAALLVLVLFAFLLIGLNLPGDAQLDGLNGVDAVGAGHLDGTAHTGTIQPIFGEAGHYGAEGADIIEVVAHEAGQLSLDIRGVCLRHLLVFLDADGREGLFVFCVQIGVVLDVEPVSGLTVHHGVDEVPDFALDTDIRDNTQQGFRVDTRRVAGVRVAVGIAVADIEEFAPVIAMLNDIANLVDGGRVVAGAHDELQEVLEAEFNHFIFCHDVVFLSLSDFRSVFGFDGRCDCLIFVFSLCVRLCLFDEALIALVVVTQLKRTLLLYAESSGILCVQLGH